MDAEDRKNKLKKTWDTQDRERRLQALEYLMNQPYGREFIWWLLGECGHGLNPFNNDALEMARNCGRLDISNILTVEIDNVDAALYIKMVKEQVDAGRDRDEQLNAIDIGEDSGDDYSRD